MKGPPQHAVAASSFFDGTRLQDECAVVIEGSCVAGIVPKGSLLASIPVRHMPEGAWLAPGFIDTQVNGFSHNFCVRPRVLNNLRISVAPSLQIKDWGGMMPLGVVHRSVSES